MGELIASNEAYLDCLKRHVLAKHGAGLDLSLCPPLRVVEADRLPKDVLTRIEEEAILVSKEQILRCKDKTPNIEEFLQGSEVDEQDSDVQLLMQNLLHEFCHVDAKKKMSNLHAYMIYSMGTGRDENGRPKTKYQVNSAKCLITKCHFFITEGVALFYEYKEIDLQGGNARFNGCWCAGGLFRVCEAAGRSGGR